MPVVRWGMYELETWNKILTSMASRMFFLMSTIFSFRSLKNITWINFSRLLTFLTSVTDSKNIKKKKTLHFF